MQKLRSDIIESAKKEKTKRLEDDMREYIIPNKDGAVFVCPYCQYESRKNSKGSAKVFKEEFFKCFACGKWRRI